MFIKFKMNKIVSSISENINIFNIFTKVYIFGSSINNKNPNDIDLLLIYKDYKDILQNEKNNISIFLGILLKLPIDITMLSEREFEETRFLEKLDSIYTKLK